MIVKLPRMNQAEIRKLIRERMVCRIAFKGEDYPYMAPFQYVYANGHLYFHFTQYGRKMELIERDSRVCVEIEKYTQDFSDYSFVVLKGTLEPVTDPEERTDVINKMAKQGARNLSKNFLAAHGLGKADDWSSLTPDRPLVVMKLSKVAEEIGLRSP
jgi:nitroimidazol reductase NimA-like FMN-containing flavoprotein (pyridoxamine 5'-phosphate oxidase superfamily)